MLEKLGGLARRFLGRGNPEAMVRPSMIPPSPRHDATEMVADPTAVVSFVSKLHDDWIQVRRSYEPEWYLNLAFYIGQQYAIWDYGLQAIREPKAPSYKTRFVSNRIMPTIRTLLGKINRGNHVGQAIPIQQTETAFSDARIAGRVLRALHDILNLDDVYDEWYLWTFTTGMGFLKIGWDPTIGPRVPLMDGSSMPIGEVAVDALGPWDCLFPADIKHNLTRPYRWIQIATHDVEIVRETYPETLWDIEPDEVAGDTGSGSYLERVRSLMTPLTGDYGRPSRKKGSTVTLIELNEDPEVLNPQDREMFPNGRVTVVAQQRRRLASQHANPYESPFPTGSRNRLVMARDDRMPGRFNGMSRIAQMAPIQTNYNRARSQVIDARDLCTKPKINVEKNHGIAKITNQPGEILERNRGTAAPTYMAPPQGSDYLWRDIADSKEEFQEISQISEVSRGQSPQANTSGIAIDMLQEADNTPLGPLAKSFASALGRAQTLIYKTAQQFYDEARTLSYVGEDQEEDVFTWYADQNPTALRIRVTPEDVFPETAAAKRVKIREAVDMGALIPGKDRTAILRGLQFGDVQSALDNDDLDRMRQNHENRMMMQGQPALVEPFDNHEIHIYQIDRVRKSPEWLKLPPEIKQLFNMHADEHLAMLAQSVTAVASMGGAPMPGDEGAGGPDGPPGAPPSGGPPGEKPPAGG